MAFLAPIDWPPTGNDVYVVLEDGSRIEGYFSSSSGAQAPRWTIKDDAKVKHKLDEARIVEVGVAVDEPPARLATSMAEALRTAKDERVALEWIVFKRVPVSEEGTMLLQVLNPGFDSWLEVYPDPYGGDSASFMVVGLTFTGGSATSWLVWRKGTPAPVRVDKKRYDEQFAGVFCPAFAAPDPLRWSSFQDHVEAADRVCAPADEH